MAVISTWAVCGQGQSTNNSSETNGNENEESISNMPEDVKPSVSMEPLDTAKTTGTDQQKPKEGEHFSGLSYDEREELGLICKSIFDIGRARFLEAKGFTVKLVRYVDRDLSPENLALIAYRQ
jgi:tRNA:m4X modification enzyme